METGRNRLFVVMLNQTLIFECEVFVLKHLEIFIMKLLNLNLFENVLNLVRVRSWCTYFHYYDLHLMSFPQGSVFPVCITEGCCLS